MDKDDAIVFLKYVEEPTLINVQRILHELATYAYMENKTRGDYQDMFVLLGIAIVKLEKIIGK